MLTVITTTHKIARMVNLVTTGTNNGSKLKFNRMGYTNDIGDKISDNCNSDNSDSNAMNDKQ